MNNVREYTLQLIVLNVYKKKKTMSHHKSTATFII